MRRVHAAHGFADGFVVATPGALIFACLRWRFALHADALLESARLSDASPRNDQR